MEGRGGEMFKWKLMARREENEGRGKGKYTKRRAIKRGKEGDSGMEREQERKDAISRPYLLIMSLYFKVQSAPVMLLHNCASADSSDPHRSDDKRMPDSRVCWAPTHSVSHILG